MAEYKLISPATIHIKGMQPADIRGLHSLLKQEGCIDSENLFSDREKAIALDGIQNRLAQRNRTDKHQDRCKDPEYQNLCLGAVSLEDECEAAFAVRIVADQRCECEE